MVRDERVLWKVMRKSRGSCCLVGDGRGADGVRCVEIGVCHSDLGIMDLMSEMFLSGT